MSPFPAQTPSRSDALRPRFILVAGLAVLLLLAMGARAEQAAAAPGFTVSPNPPTAGQEATYTATGVDATNVVEWTFQGEVIEKVGQSVSHTFSSPGPKLITMKVTDVVAVPPAVTSFSDTVQVNAPPAGSFTYAPVPPTAGDPTVFLANHTDSDGDALSYSWEFGDGGVGSGESPTHEYATAGPQTVQLTVRDGRGGVDVDQAQLNVQAPPPPPPPGPPRAGFVFLPNSPLVGEDVEFVSTSDAAQGASITDYNWDFDADGSFDDASGESVTRKAPLAPGAWTVRLKVVQSTGDEAIAERTIVVRSLVAAPPPPPPATPANQPPTATFAYAPRAARTGDTVEFLSASTDPDGQIATQVWDLDGDNLFDDAAGARASWRYTTPGARRVKLRVTDNLGASTVREAIVTVGARAAAARFLIPFPVVRLTGRVYRRYTQVKSLGARAPRGAVATVRCSGRSCPRRTQSKRLGKSRKVSFPTFKRRLRVGVRLSVSVKRRGYVGKYTRFRVRAGAAPARLDRCLVPGSSKPKRCPTR